MLSEEDCVEWLRRPVGLVSHRSYEECGIFMCWTVVIVAAFREDRLVETPQMDKGRQRCVVQPTEYHKADLLTRTGRGWELIDSLASLSFRPQLGHYN
jgi:hypothetical protein